MQNDFRTIAFNENCEKEMVAFIDTHWDRVIDVQYQTEYQHPGSYDAYVVKIKPPEPSRKPKLSDILQK